MTQEPPISVPLCAVFRSHLKHEGHKFTAERARVLDAVIEMDRVFEADELLYSLRERRFRVSKATVYRTLKLLQDAGIIEPVHLDQRQSHFRLSYGQRQQDQMICVETGRIVEIDVPELEAIRERLAAEHGWQTVGHRLQIFGVCPESNDPSVTSE